MVLLRDIVTIQNKKKRRKALTLFASQALVTTLPDDRGYIKHYAYGRIWVTYWEDVAQFPNRRQMTMRAWQDAGKYLIIPESIRHAHSVMVLSGFKERLYSRIATASGVAGLLAEHETGRGSYGLSWNDLEPYRETWDQSWPLDFEVDDSLF